MYLPAKSAARLRELHTRHVPMCAGQGTCCWWRMRKIVRRPIGIYMAQARLPPVSEAAQRNQAPRLWEQHRDKDRCAL